MPIRIQPQRCISCTDMMPLVMKREPPVYGCMYSTLSRSVPVMSSPTSLMTLLAQCTSAVASSASSATPQLELAGEGGAPGGTHQHRQHRGREELRPRGQEQPARLAAERVPCQVFVAGLERVHGVLDHAGSPGSRLHASDPPTRRSSPFGAGRRQRARAALRTRTASSWSRASSCSSMARRDWSISGSSTFSSALARRSVRRYSSTRRRRLAARAACAASSASSARKASAQRRSSGDAQHRPGDGHDGSGVQGGLAEAQAEESRASPAAAARRRARRAARPSGRRNRAVRSPPPAPPAPRATTRRCVPGPRCGRAAGPASRSPAARASRPAARSPPAPGAARRAVPAARRGSRQLRRLQARG